MDDKAIFDLEAARITSLPQTGYYVSDFITEDEENLFLQKVYSFH